MIWRGRASPTAPDDRRVPGTDVGGLHLDRTLPRIVNIAKHIHGKAQSFNLRPLN